GDIVQGGALFCDLAAESYDNTFTECICVGFASERQRIASFCNKLFVYCNRPLTWLTYFNSYDFSADSHVTFTDGHVAAHTAVQWLHVSGGEHACALAGDFQCGTREVVLHYCKRYHDQGTWFCVGVERDFDSVGHDCLSA